MQEPRDETETPEPQPPQPRPRRDICTMVRDEGRFVGVLAPMVRYSKMPFRVCCHRWGCDVAYSPMLVADSFIRCAKARDHGRDRPLVVQFAVSDPCVFAEAAAYVARDCDGVDLNCGCPESWVNRLGDGAALMHRPELVADMVRQARGACSVPVSIKMRVLADVRDTVEVARRAEAAGCAHVVVHGRTRAEGNSGPVRLAHIRAVKDAVGVPVVANGGIMTHAQALAVRAATGADGVMAARGLLRNPALFARINAAAAGARDVEPFDVTPLEAVHDYLHLAAAAGTPWGIMHRHLAWMLFAVLGRADKRRTLNSFASLAGALDFLDAEGLAPPAYAARDGLLGNLRDIARWPLDRVAHTTPPPPPSRRPRGPSAPFLVNNDGVPGADVADGPIVADGAVVDED